MRYPTTIELTLCTILSLAVSLCAGATSGIVIPDIASFNQSIVNMNQIPTAAALNYYSNSTSTPTMHAAAPQNNDGSMPAATNAYGAKAPLPQVMQTLPTTTPANLQPAPVQNTNTGGILLNPANSSPSPKAQAAADNNLFFLN